MTHSIIKAGIVLVLTLAASTGFGQQRGESQRGPMEIKGRVMEGETGQP